MTELGLPTWLYPVAGALVVLALLAATYRLWLRLLGVVLVPDDSVGVVYKKFVLMGSNRALPEGCIVAPSASNSKRNIARSPRSVSSKKPCPLKSPNGTRVWMALVRR